MSEEVIRHETGNQLRNDTPTDSVDVNAETASSVGQQEAYGLEVVEKAFDSREKDDDGFNVGDNDGVNAATDGNQSQVACRLIYKDASLRLEPLDSNSTFDKLVKDIDAKILADGNQEDIERLEYNHVADKGATSYSVVDTSSLQAVLQLFRDSYEARKRAAMEALVTQVERLVNQNEADSIEEAALMMESLLQTKVSVEVQLRLLKTLVAALQTPAGTEGSVSRELLERASLVFIVNGTGKVRKVMYGRPVDITGKLFPQSKSARQPELSAFGVLILATIASTPPGARILLQPDCFPEILARIVQTPAGFRAETAAKALTAAVSASEVFVSIRITPESIMLLTKLLRSHDSWEVRQCVASILAMVGRHVHIKETRIEQNSESCLFSSSSMFWCDEDGASQRNEEVRNHQNSSKSLADNIKDEFDDPANCLDSTADEASGDTKLGASQNTVSYAVDGWKELLRYPQVLSSAIESAQVASREVMPAYKHLQMTSTKFSTGKRSAFVSIVRQCISSEQTSTVDGAPSTVDGAPSSGIGQIGRTVALSSKCRKAVSSTLEISAHLAWLVSHCLTGHEDWVSSTIISALLEMALYPLSPPELRCVAVNSTATLSRMCRHIKFAKILAKERDILKVIRSLSERDAVPNVQCWALTILQALLEVSTDIRDELVVTHFRSRLASQMLERAYDARYTSFMTLGAHVLASLTQLTLEYFIPNVGESENTEDRRARMKMLARSTVIGMSNYTRSIITLLHDGPPVSLRYTAVHLWLLSRIPHIRDDLVQKRVVTMLVPRIEAFIRVLCPRRRITSSTPEDEKEKWVSQRGLVKGLDETGRVHTLNQLAATLWMMLQSHKACNECITVGANIIIQHIVELHGTTYATARRLLLCCLWQLAYHDTGLQRRLLEVHVTGFFIEDTPSSQTSTTTCDAGDEAGESNRGNKVADVAKSENTSQPPANHQRRNGVSQNELRALAVHQLYSLRESNLDSKSLSLINAAAAAVAVRTSPKESLSTHHSFKTGTKRRMAVSASPDSINSTFHDFLGYIGCHGESQGVELRMVACRFYYYLVECAYERAIEASEAASSERSNPDVRRTLCSASIAQIHETALKMASMLLQIQGPSMHEAHEQGALIVAKEARSAARKLAFARAGTIEKLMCALRQATSSRESQTTTAILHALFNISTHPANQVRIIRCGFTLLIRHGRGSPAGTHATAFATRILENCRHQPGVASTYYKGELRFKSDELRRRAAKKETPAGGDLRKPLVASISPTACHRCVTEDVSAEFAACATVHGALHQPQTTQKLDSSKFKHRFESFLHKLGQDNDDAQTCCTKQPKCVNPAVAAMPVTCSGRDMQSQRKPATFTPETLRMPTLNAELSRSIIDIWGQSRPASGSPQTPVFSPRSTWSPRIKSCQIKRCDKDLGTLASLHVPQRPTEGNRQIPPPKESSLPHPSKDEDVNALGDMATKILSNRGQDISDGAPLPAEQSMLNLLLRRRKPNPMSVAIEGGCKFTFHRLVHDHCEELDEKGDNELEIEDGDQEVLVKFPHIEGSRVCDGLFDSFNLPDGTCVYYYYRGRHHGRYVGVSKSFPILPAEDLNAIIGEAQLPSGPKSPELPQVFWPGLPDSSQPRLILKRMRERRGLNGRQMLEAAYESHDPTSLYPEYRSAGAESDLNGSPASPSTRHASSGGHRANEISFDNILSLELPWRSNSLNSTAVSPNDTTVSPGASSESVQGEKCDNEWRIQDSAVWISRGPEMAHPGSSRDYVHNQRFWARCALHDWSVMTKRTRFIEKLRRVVNSDDAAFQAELQALKRIVVKNAELTSHVFHYFSAVFGSNTHSLGELGFKEFASACKIPDRRSKSCNSITITTIFVEANVDYPQANEKRKIAASETRNLVSQLVRFEFVQALVLLANAKYVASGMCESLAEALQKLLQENVARVGEIEARASYDPDTFRTHSLYNADVEAALLPHLPFFHELYTAYNPTTAVKRRMSCADFHRLMSEANFYDDTFTRHEGRLAFVFAQMKIADWTRYYDEFATITLADFIEALCRVSIVKAWPSDTVLIKPMSEVLDFFDNFEAYASDPKKAAFVERPMPYHNRLSHNVASRIKKLLFALYRRLATKLPGNDNLHAKCLRPGIARAAAQLGLSNKREGEVA